MPRNQTNTVRNCRALPTLPALFALSATIFTPATISAQSGGFVATLGNDTVQVESFTRRGNRLDGVIVTHPNATRVIEYSMTFDAAGHPLQYDVKTTAPDGTPVTTIGSSGSLRFTADSIVRDAWNNGAMQTTRIPAPSGAVPSPSIPYVGVSYLMYEIAFNAARHRAADSTHIYLLTMFPQQATPQRSSIWFVGSDSAELNYFNVARSGYRFNKAGELIRADWTNTTYRYHVLRTSSAPDVRKIAAAWGAADRAGKGMGVMSPRDTSRATVGAAQILVDYSRPARRGRNIWGDVVPFDHVWRLGADFATQLESSGDLQIGSASIPAGGYTLWMLPQQSGPALLVVNKQVRIFGTQYDSTHDLVRIPLERHNGVPTVERLTLEISGGQFWIRWGDVAWSVPVTNRGAE